MIQLRIGRASGLLALAFAASTVCAKLLPCQLYIEDFSKNKTATDQTKFPGHYSDIEIDVPGGTGAVPAMVQVQHADPVLSLTFYNPNIRGDPNGHFHLYNGTFTDADGTVYPITFNGSATYDQDVAIPARGTISINPVQLSNLPSYVTIGTLKYSFLLSSPTGIGLGGIGIGIKTYVVDDTPKDHMTIPWFEVLDLACTWANDLAGPANCSRACTFGLYYSQQFAYDLHTHNVPAMWFNPYTGNFMLKTFLNTSGYKSGNCVDVSTFNSLCTTALGETTVLNQQITSYSFVTFKVCPIGSDSTQLANYYYALFGMHQQAHVGGNVFDAALAFIYDLSGAAYMNPPANWPMPGYWQTPSSPSPMYGLTMRYLDLNYDYVYDDGHYFTWTIDPTRPSQPVPFTTNTFTYPGVE
ncbi:MAG TPA: hypothetical protein VHE55_03940 [Fimbriimonadaceae bacterium]|nr:hypothetical protein [Fimbriimonadaceae bacterium]